MVSTQADAQARCPNGPTGPAIVGQYTWLHPAYYFPRERPVNSTVIESQRMDQKNQSVRGRAVVRGIVLGGLTSGLIDLVYASAQTAFKGGSVLRPWMGVASGLIGQAARNGGAGVALLGVALHFVITFGAAALLTLILWRLPWFVKRPLITGVLFGFGFLLVMNYVILPLSAIGRPIYVGQGFLTAILGHVIMMGLPIAWFVTRGIGGAKSE